MRRRVGGGVGIDDIDAREDAGGVRQRLLNRSDGGDGHRRGGDRCVRGEEQYRAAGAGAGHAEPLRGERRRGSSAWVLHQRRVRSQARRSSKHHSVFILTPRRSASSSWFELVVAGSAGATGLAVGGVDPAGIDDGRSEDASQPNNQEEGDDGFLRRFPLLLHLIGEDRNFEWLGCRFWRGWRAPWWEWGEPSPARKSGSPPSSCSSPSPSP